MSELRVTVVEQPHVPPVFRLVQRPPLPPGSALVSVLACALDADDERLIGGAAPRFPLWPGRYFVGAIDGLGTGLTEDATGNRLRPGTPVLAPSVIPCGVCALCRDPPRHAPGCLSPLRLGIDSHPSGLSGGLADAVFVPNGAMHALTLTMPPWLATLAESFATCLRAFARAQAIGRFPPGASVLILGRDATALLAVVAARELGAGRVILIGAPDTPFLRLARQCGAEATIDAMDVPDPDERVAITRETVAGRGVDLALACDPGHAVAPEALGSLREGGTLVLLAAADAGDGGAWAVIRQRQLAVLGVTGFASADIPVALAMLFRARDRYPFAAMHGRFPFSQAGLAEALAALREGRVPRSLIVQRPDLAG
jgi:threonine dehydrogenase-like Zn-dependent dehydrogenase